MKILKNKTQLFTIAFALTLIISTILITFPFVNAQEPDAIKTTYAYIGTIPNPVGVNQEVLLHFGITDYLFIVTDGWEGLTITVTKPDGTTETLGPFKTDSTGGTGTVYVPTQAGTYFLTTHFPEQTYFWPDNRRAPIPGGGLIKYLASDSVDQPLVVLDEPREYYPGAPLPTQYWSRPIDSQHREWYTISANYLE